MPVDLKQMGIDQLSVVDRLNLIEQIWNSLPEQVAAEEISASQLAELDERLAQVETEPGQGEPWREMLDRLTEK